MLFLYPYLGAGKCQEPEPQKKIEPLIDMRALPDAESLKQFVEIFLGRKLEAWQENVMVIMLPSRRPASCHKGNDTIQ